jgi:hypothetical protein
LRAARTGKCCAWRAPARGRISSFHRDGAAGLFAQDWAREIKAVGEFGEA